MEGKAKSRPSLQLDSTEIHSRHVSAFQCELDEALEQVEELKNPE